MKRITQSKDYISIVFIFIDTVPLHLYSHQNYNSQLSMVCFKRITTKTIFVARDVEVTCSQLLHAHFEELLLAVTIL